MSRYIDTDKLICAIDGAESLDTERDYDEVARFIEEAETADVEEVRHGKWIKLNTGYNATDVYECSLCGRHLYVDKNTSNARIQKIAPYCHCGAKMDLTEVK